VLGFTTHWSDWQPVANALVMGELSHAAAIGLDWLSDAVNASARAAIVAGLVQRGAAPFKTCGTITGWQLLAADVQLRGSDGRASAAAAPRRPAGTLSQEIESALAQLEEGRDQDGEQDAPPRCSSASEAESSGDAAAAVGVGGEGQGRLDAEYEVLCELGRGAFGRALKARRRADGALVCIKSMELGAMSKKDRAVVSDHNFPPGTWEAVVNTT
jgi:hypothetical protein